MTQKIIHEKKDGIRLFFLVKWEGYDEPTWEPRASLQHAKKAIAAFRKSTRLREKKKKEKKIFLSGKEQQ